MRTLGWKYAFKILPAFEEGDRLFGGGGAAPQLKVPSLCGVSPPPRQARGVVPLPEGGEDFKFGISPKGNFKSNQFI